jgi:hypothetical protein
MSMVMAPSATGRDHKVIESGSVRLDVIERNALGQQFIYCLGGLLGIAQEAEANE